MHKTGGCESSMQSPVTQLTSCVINEHSLMSDYPHFSLKYSCRQMGCGQPRLAADFILVFSIAQSSIIYQQATGSCSIHVDNYANHSEKPFWTDLTSYIFSTVRPYKSYRIP